MKFSDIHPKLKSILTSVSYHLVSDSSSDLVNNLYRHRSHKSFQSDLNFYRRYFNPVSLDQVIDHQVKGSKLPDWPLFLSFDDGHRENCAITAPLLEQNSFPATFFLITSIIDNKKMILPHLKSLILEQLSHALPRETEIELAEIFNVQSISEVKAKVFSIRNYSRDSLLEKSAKVTGLNVADYLHRHEPYLTSQQVKSLISRGFTIGAHSHNHFKFSTLTADEQEGELTNALTIIRSFEGAAGTIFAFPNSGAGINEQQLLTWSDRYDIHCFFDTQGFYPNTRLRINRVVMDQTLSSAQLEEPCAEEILTEAARRRLYEPVYQPAG